MLKRFSRVERNTSFEDRFLNIEIEMVYIYSTSPVKRIVGRFTIEEIIEGHPKNLWKSFRDFSGIEDKEFFSYFGAAEKGFAIKIEKVEVFKEPIDPKISIPDFVPPIVSIL